LGFPLEVALSKKIGHPSNPEYAIGSVTLDSAVVNENAAGVPMRYIEEETARLQAKLRENFRLFMGGHTPTNLKGKTVIVVDDGIATGHTMVSMVQAIRKSQPGKLVVAVPVAPPHAAHQLRPLVDEYVCLSQPEGFMAVGQFYVDFEQVSDEEVIALLHQNAASATNRGGIVL
jgi:predicted phosphoribosyltransferase